MVTLVLRNADLMSDGCGSCRKTWWSQPFACFTGVFSMEMVEPLGAQKIMAPEIDRGAGKNGTGKKDGFPGGGFRICYYPKPWGNDPI